MHVLVQKTTGSGHRDNRYATGETDKNDDNKLVFVGSRDAFVRSNPKIKPPPDAEFFEYSG